jgi:hypothetical protein
LQQKTACPHMSMKCKDCARAHTHTHRLQQKTACPHMSMNANMHTHTHTHTHTVLRKTVRDESLVTQAPASGEVPKPADVEINPDAANVDGVLYESLGLYSSSGEFRKLKVNLNYSDLCRHLNERLESDGNEMGDVCGEFLAVEKLRKEDVFSDPSYEDAFLGITEYRAAAVVFWPRKRPFFTSICEDECEEMAEKAAVCAEEGDFETALQLMDRLMSNTYGTAMIDVCASMIETCAVIGLPALQMAHRVILTLLLEADREDWDTDCGLVSCLTPQFTSAIKQLCDSLGMESVEHSLNILILKLPMSIFDASFVQLLSSPGFCARAPQYFHMLVARLLDVYEGQGAQLETFLQACWSVLLDRDLSMYAGCVSKALNDVFYYGDRYEFLKGLADLAYECTEHGVGFFSKPGCNSTDEFVEDGPPRDGRDVLGCGGGSSSSWHGDAHHHHHCKHAQNDDEMCDNSDSGSGSELDSDSVTEDADTPAASTMEALREILVNLFDDKRLGWGSNSSAEFAVCVFACKDKELVHKLLNTVMVLQYMSPYQLDPGLVTPVLLRAIMYQEHYGCMDTVLDFLNTHMQLIGEELVPEWINGLEKLCREMASLSNKARQSEDGQTHVSRRLREVDFTFDEAKLHRGFATFAVRVISSALQSNPPNLAADHCFSMIQTLCTLTCCSHALISLLRDLFGIACEQLLSEFECDPGSDSDSDSDSEFQSESESESESESGPRYRYGRGGEFSTRQRVASWRALKLAIVALCQFSQRHDSDSESDESLIDSCIEQWARAPSTAFSRLFFGLRKMQDYPESSSHDKGVHAGYCMNRLGEFLCKRDFSTFSHDELPAHVMLLRRISLCSDCACARVAQKTLLDTIKMISGLEETAQENVLKKFFHQYEPMSLSSEMCPCLRVLTRCYIEILNRQASAMPLPDYAFPLAVHPHFPAIQEFLRGKDKTCCVRFWTASEAAIFWHDGEFVNSMQSNGYYLAVSTRQFPFCLEVILEKRVAAETEERRAAFFANRNMVEMLQYALSAPLRFQIGEQPQPSPCQTGLPSTPSPSQTGLPSTPSPCQTGLPSMPSPCQTDVSNTVSARSEDKEGHAQPTTPIRSAMFEEDKDTKALGERALTVKKRKINENID